MRKLRDHVADEIIAKTQGKTTRSSDGICGQGVAQPRSPKREFGTRAGGLSRRYEEKANGEGKI